MLELIDSDRSHRKWSGCIFLRILVDVVCVCVCVCVCVRACVGVGVGVADVSTGCVAWESHLSVKSMSLPRIAIRNG